ncbi:hypothetical protein RJ641_026435 [Dillenia turbinata]|uniref:Dilute domain-containing protein n=1 Tax=Dillenia turbinata TaxID=194707 RepID=A0AAN8ZSJ7_9MAGN
MKEIDKKKTPNNNLSKRSARTERRDKKLHQDKANKNLDVNFTESKATNSKQDSTILASDLNVGRKPSEVCENMVVHYMDDAYRSEETTQYLKVEEMVANGDKERMSEVCSADLEKESKQGNEGDSDTETRRDSVSSYGDSQIAEDEKEEMATRVPKSLAKKNTSEDLARAPRGRSNCETNKSKPKALHNAPKKSKYSGSGPGKLSNKSTAVNPFKNIKVPSNPPSESSEGVDDNSVEEEKEGHLLDETSNGNQSVCSDDETVDGDGEENGEHENNEDLDRKIEEMESRVEKLEEELREVAALEISVYSVVPEHGSSSHKVHTPARRLSRLYLHACKHWTQNKCATIAKNTVSGLVLVAKSCGNDVPRLTFWLSNMVVLREIISQSLGSSCQPSSVTKFAESGVAKRNEAKSPSLKWKGNLGGRQASKPSILQFVDDWQETRTFTAALEKVECWIFSRIVESVWWQTLTPHMQSPVEDLHTPKSIGRLLGPALGDQQQGSFSINLWKNAFQDAFQRLCPVRAGGHECGCLPVLARMVMEQCVARLDVAMFNAILRESAHEIPTDPVSDPIVDPKVLPIPAGDLSFGSGAQIKISIGAWSRWLSDMFGMDSDDTVKQHGSSEDDDRHGGDSEPKSFLLLNSLSDLLMLPKDMLMDCSIRQEVCPSIGLPLIKRILCNFTPDEFCPDAVPGVVLELLNAESIAEHRLLGDSSNSFPCQAAPVVYVPPSPADVAEKVAEAGGKSQMMRNASIIRRKGYTSDEELEEMNSPLTSIVDKLPTSPTVVANGNENGIRIELPSGINVRYELLREVWSM